MDVGKAGRVCEVRNKPKGGTEHCVWVGVDRATVRLLLAVGALHVNERHRAEVKGRRKKRIR